MEAGLAAARLIHYAAAAGLFGLCLFPLYGERLRSQRRWAVGLSAIALTSAAAWLLLVTASLAGALDVESLAIVIGEMPFGRVWSGRLAIGAALILLLALGRDGKVPAALAAVFLGSIALTGHTQLRGGTVGVLHTFSDAVHLLGAGAWLGGLIGLALLLRSSSAPAAAVGRFSRMAYWAVGALVISGVVNSALLVGRVEALATTPYGRLLSLKLLLFLAMLGFAAVNRLSLSPQLAGGEAAAGGRLRRHVLAEQALGLAVLACVAVLGASEPPVS